MYMLAVSLFARFVMSALRRACALVNVYKMQRSGSGSTTWPMWRRDICAGALARIFIYTLLYSTEIQPGGDDDSDGGGDGDGDNCEYYSRVRAEGAAVPST